MINVRVSSCAPDLVNAQTNVNRAVFEMNKMFGNERPKEAPDPAYIQRCVIEALESLVQVLKWLNPTPRKSSEKRKASE
jgi:hypothetical protein